LIKRPPVFTNRYCRLVSEQFSILFGSAGPKGHPPPQVPQVAGDRAQPQPHLVGTQGLQAGGQGRAALPDLLRADQPEGRILGKALGPSRVLVAGQAAVDRLPQQISGRKLRVLPPLRIPLMPISDSGAMPITVGAQRPCSDHCRRTDRHGPEYAGIKKKSRSKRNCVTKSLLEYVGATTRRDHQPVTSSVWLRDAIRYYAGGSWRFLELRSEVPAYVGSRLVCACRQRRHCRVSLRPGSSPLAHFAGLAWSTHIATRSERFASPTHMTVSAPPQ